MLLFGHRTSPNAASATPSSTIRSPAPTPSSASSTTGWDHRSSRLGGTRFTSRSVLTLPTPARIGTAARKAGSSASDTPYRSWMAGIRVTSRAKATPCTKKLNANEPLPRRSTSVMAASVGPRPTRG
ncbi:hypothetical protein SPURM210S_07816 [Streptomyces purpurascens]